MFEFLNVVNFGENLWVLIVILAILTYMTRSGGDLVLSRFKRIHPRVDAALEAVPAAVITAIVVPLALTNGVSGFIAIMVSMLACLKISPILSMVLGMGMLVLLRNLGL